MSKENSVKMNPHWGADAEITITDLAGDENHYSATIKSKEFKGKTKIEQHKMVYKSLKGKMGNELHALALNTMEV